MTQFNTVTGLVVPFDRENVDTDLIIPARLLSRMEPLGPYLFGDLRYNENGGLREEFVMNLPRYKGASIMVAGKNFGCGSSREHAVWALVANGIRVVISESFGDIFRKNGVFSGLLPVVLAEKKVKYLMERSSRETGYRLSVDLEAKSVSDDREVFEFKIGDFDRECFLKGLDQISWTLQREDLIAAYEARTSQRIGLAPVSH
jgi:3-isopropylmalate/(R)-2-methylmalate dehydratase small subunit